MSPWVSRLRELAANAWRNFSQTALAGVFAGIATGFLEAFLCLHRAEGDLDVLVLLRFFPTALTLGLVLGIVLGLAQGLVCTILLGEKPLGWLVEPVRAGEGEPEQPRMDRATPFVWAAALSLVILFNVVARASQSLQRGKSEKTLIAYVTAMVAVMAVVFLLMLSALIVRGLTARAPLLAFLGRGNPLRSLPAALAVMLTGVLVLFCGLYFLAARAPHTSSLRALADRLPFSLIYPLVLLLVIDGVFLLRHAHGRRLIPDGPRRQRHLLITLGASSLTVLLALFWLGAHPVVKYLAGADTERQSPLLAMSIKWIRQANDFDRDGMGSVLGENDCAPFNRHIHPGAVDIPDNGIDENCWGGDLSAKAMHATPGSGPMPVPKEFRRDYNILFVTIDTLRYDHTGFGGYQRRTKPPRDTTPNLDRLAEESVTFTDVHAPSAGTMASMPAILTSKFFHSGVALGPERPRKGPMILPENRLMAEVFRDTGYRTGAIVSHDYFVDWGTDQGIDRADYDQEIAEAERDPMLISSPRITDKAIAWISRNAGRKWFYWAHYLDPHGRYVAHPGEKSFGSGSEEDLYDGEIAFTDKHVGRLIDHLRKNTTLWGNTIVVVTSDHGDGFNEHGLINHAVALYREMIQVPLIIRIPELAPRITDQIATPLDVLPTLSEIVGAPIGRPVEGISLAGAIFYGKTDPDRVVFAETNLPVPQRAAITSGWKIIANLRSNTYQLYDRKADPEEKNNIYATSSGAATKMRTELKKWLERVFFARDTSNQSWNLVRANHLGQVPGSMDKKVAATIAGAIEVLGYDLNPKQVTPGGKLAVTVYYRSLRTTDQSLRMELELVGEGPAGAPPEQRPRTSNTVIFGFGHNLTTSWRPGDIVRETLELTVPAHFPPTKATLYLRLTDDSTGRTPADVTAGPTETGKEVVLGDLPLGLAQAPVGPDGGAPPLPPTPGTPTNFKAAARGR